MMDDTYREPTQYTNSILTDSRSPFCKQKKNNKITQKGSNYYWLLLILEKRMGDKLLLNRNHSLPWANDKHHIAIRRSGKHQSHSIPTEHKAMHELPKYHRRRWRRNDGSPVHHQIHVPPNKITEEEGTWLICINDPCLNHQQWAEEEVCLCCLYIQRIYNKKFSDSKESKDDVVELQYEHPWGFLLPKSRGGGRGI